MSLKIGAQLYSLHDHTSNFEESLEMLKQVKTMGYNSCQISGFEYAFSFSDYKKLMDLSGLQCVCTHIDFEELEANIDHIIENHKLINCHYIGIGIMPKEYMTSEEGYKVFANKVNAIAKRLLDADMHLIYHNHHVEFMKFPKSGLLGMELLLKHFSPDVQFEPDFFWIQAGGGNPVEWIKRLSGRMDVVHLKEMGGSLNFEKWNMVPIGDGAMNWRDIISACEEAGAKFAMVEQDNALETDSIVCMRRSAEYLRKIGCCF